MSTTSCKISSHQFGHVGGKPILFFHGFPGSGAEARLLELFAHKEQFQVFAFDRPGYGATDIAWAKDYPGYFKSILQQIPHPGKIVVVGISGGGPYASEFSRLFPERIQSLNLVCAVAGLQHPKVVASFRSELSLLLKLFPHIPAPLTKSIFHAASLFRGPSPEKFFEKFMLKLPIIDQEAIRTPELSRVMYETYNVSRQQRLQGAAADLHFYRTWAPKSDISKSFKIRIYHGNLDTIVPVQSSAVYSEAWPHASIELSEDGHFSLPLRKLKKIVNEIATEDK